MPSSEAPTANLPATIRPMLARLTRRPFDSPDHIYEPKWDGIRALAFADNGAIRIQTRNLNNVTSRFPELASIPESLSSDGVVLDGEVVCLDEDGRPSFSAIQQRFGWGGTHRLAFRARIWT